jgi:hypothetical protein
MAMAKVQVYLPAAELRALHVVARRQKRRVADLVREAVRQVWWRENPSGPIALWDGLFAGPSMDHAAACCCIRRAVIAQAENAFVDTACGAR